MKTQPAQTLLRLFATLFAVAAVPLSASVLMLDFGPTVTSDTTNSPYHDVEPGTGTTWEQVQLSAITTGLNYADGSDATGVTVTVGRSSSLDWQTLTLKEAADPSSAVLASTTNTGVFGGTSVGRDGIFYGSGASMVGISVGGLGAGTYDVYVVGFNTNKSIGVSAAMGVWALATPNNDDRSMAAHLATPHAVTSNSVSGSWIEGSNYVKLSVTLTETDSFLTIFTHGTTAEEQRGFLNSVQIVPTSIPEPATTTAMAGLIVLGGVACMHKRARK